jgi:hypothetical protein
MTRPPRPARVVAGLLGFAALLLVPLLTGDDSIPESGKALMARPAEGGGQPCQTRWGPAREIGRLPGQRKEVSGFVSSPTRPGLAWMVRDSGNPATLYSFELEPGEDTIRSEAFPVRGATNGDWEDVTYTTGPDGRGRLWIMDNVNRHTAPKMFWEVAEPDVGHDKDATVVNRYRWEYPDAPDGNFDTETAFFAGGRLSVVSKTEPSRVYTFAAPLDPSTVNRPTLVATVPAGVKMTLGSTSADERLLVTSSTRNQTAWVYLNRHAPSDAAGFFDRGAPPLFSRKLSRSQREAGDFFPYDGCDIVLLSEKQNVWLLQNGAGR